MIRKRVISILMSTAMLCTNIIPAMQVMASETPAAEEVQTETERTKLFVTLEKVNGLTYGYEDSHYETTDGKGNTILSYYEDDKVKLDLTVSDDHMLERIQSVTSDGKDIPMEWTAENKIRFTMPGRDVHVWLYLRCCNHHHFTHFYTLFPHAGFFCGRHDVRERKRMI